MKKFINNEKKIKHILIIIALMLCLSLAFIAGITLISLQQIDGIQSHQNAFSEIEIKATPLTKVKEVNLSEENNWKESVSLPKYDENGALINYTVDEETIPEGYSKKIDGYKITNTINKYNYTVEYYYDGIKDDSKIETISSTYGATISTYTDKNITGYKLEKEEGLGLEVDVDESKNVIKIYYIKDSFNYTVRYFYDNVEDVSKRETIKATYKDVINSYEDKVKPGYIFEKVENKGFTVTENEDTNYINVYYSTERTTLSGTKTWKDNNNALGLRPENYVVKLYANGNYVKETSFKESTWEFTGLQKYDYETGKAIVYTISEDEITLENGDKYVPTINGTDIVNTLTGTVNIEVNKIWEDGNNANNTRPNSILAIIRAIFAD